MAKDLSKITSERIKALRTSKQLTMEILAKKIGVSKSTIAKWENGYVENMRQERIIKLAEVFNVSPTYIMGYDDDQQERDDRFIERYEQLDDSQKQLVNQMIEAFLKKQ